MRGEQGGSPNVLDPATETKQDEIITAIDKISNNQVATDMEGLGNITIGTTQVEIDISGKTESIRIRADTTNTGIIFIGKTGVLSNGTNDFTRLESGDEMIIDYDDATNGIFAISNVATQKINVGILL